MNSGEITCPDCRRPIDGRPVPSDDDRNVMLHFGCRAARRKVPIVSPVQGLAVRWRRMMRKGGSSKTIDAVVVEEVSNERVKVEIELNGKRVQRYAARTSLIGMPAREA